MFELFPTSYRRQLQEPTVVPILDMLTSIIFFLLLSTTFLEFTKQTLPPSVIEKITDPVKPPPVAPRLFVGKSGKQTVLHLVWSGVSPGTLTKRIASSFRAPSSNYPNDIRIESQKIISQFIKRFPLERTLQVGLSSQVNYQNLIAVMDGVQSTMPDIVLISYSEAEANLSRL